MEYKTKQNKTEQNSYVKVTAKGSPSGTATTTIVTCIAQQLVTGMKNNNSRTPEESIIPQ